MTFAGYIIYTIMTLAYLNELAEGLNPEEVLIVLERYTTEGRMSWGFDDEHVRLERPNKENMTFHNKIFIKVSL